MIFSRILYWLVIKPISLLPYWLLYGVSDIFFVILYYIVGYRKKVVTDNLRKSYPEKPEKEILRIRRRFYHHFCDLVVESLKNFSIKLEQAQSRMKQEGTEILNHYYDQGKSVILCGGHYCNWELWAVATAPYFRHELAGIYKRLNNKYFDEKMKKSRGKFGLKLVSTRETGDYLREHVNDLITPILAIDQSPTDPKKCVWVEFLGRETAALFGAEKYAKEYDLPVVYCRIYKTKRGHYRAVYETVTEKPREMGHGEIIQKVHRILEENMREAPEYWLWSHKRWKHKRPENENFQGGAPNE